MTHVPLTKESMNGIVQMQLADYYDFTSIDNDNEEITVEWIANPEAVKAGEESPVHYRMVVRLTVEDITAEVLNEVEAWQYDQDHNGGQ